MFFDTLSSKINIYYRFSNRDRNYFAGILNILVYLGSIGISAYFLKEMLERKNPKSNMVSKYEDDVGNVELSNKELMHIVTMADKNYKFYATHDRRLFSYKGLLYDLNSELLASY